MCLLRIMDHNQHQCNLICYVIPAQAAVRQAHGLSEVEGESSTLSSLTFLYAGSSPE